MLNLALSLSLLASFALSMSFARAEELPGATVFNPSRVDSTALTISAAAPTPPKIAVTQGIDTIGAPGVPSTLILPSPVPLPMAVVDSAMPTVNPFKVDRRLKRNVEFWIRIYTQYDTKEGVIHDAKYIDKIYEVLHFEEGLSHRKQARQVKDAKKKWKEVLMVVSRKQKDPDKMNEEERRVFNMFSDVTEPDKFSAAAQRKRLRFQLGQKDRFKEGLYLSGLYIPYMEEVFRREGLPLELTRLPFVESSFNIHARSKVGASGVWQFMRSTGRFFLRINDTLDERNDPLRATEAAAKLLKANYEALKSWPLAVTAYNHGRQGMLRAVQRVGSDDLEDLVDEYRSRSFGFASTNFFTCLLAAIEVEKNSEKYFGKVERAQPVMFYEAQVPDSVALKDLVKFMSLDMKQLKELNPGLTSLVFQGRRPVPGGYNLRLPLDGNTGKESAAQVFLAGYSQIPKTFKVPQAGKRKRHTR